MVTPIQKSIPDSACRGTCWGQKSSCPGNTRYKYSPFGADRSAKHFVVEDVVIVQKQVLAQTLQSIREEQRSIIFIIVIIFVGG